MDAQDLIQTAGDMIASTSADDVVAVVGRAGGFMLKEAGKISLGVLVKPHIEDLCNRFRQYQTDRKIPEDFEQTNHGAALLEEALNSLLEGLESERAEAIKKMFLGLAMSPVEDSLARIEQLEIMRVTGELSAWEIVLINAMERYQNEVFDSIRADQWTLAKDNADQRNNITQIAQRQARPLEEWLLRFCRDDRSRFRSLRDAAKSLESKRILRSTSTGLNQFSAECVYKRSGAFSEFGWKLVTHLYSATEAPAGAD